VKILTKNYLVLILTASTSIIKASTRAYGCIIFGINRACAAIRAWINIAWAFLKLFKKLILMLF
jgi:hypothetical protein